MKFDPPLEKGIKKAVIVLNSSGIETFESCEGGKGHAFPEPTIRFHGGKGEGFKAVAIAMDNNLSVSALRRVYDMLDGELTGPYWEITFAHL